jgi:hypothetical protein
MPPVFRKLETGLTKSLLMVEGEKDLRLEFDTAQVAAMKETQEALDKRATELVQGSVATLNEARLLAGLAPDPKGDVYLRPFSLTEVPVGGGEA